MTIDEIKGCPQWEVECSKCSFSEGGCGKLPKFCKYCGSELKIKEVWFQKTCPNLEQCEREQTFYGEKI